MLPDLALPAYLLPILAKTKGYVGLVPEHDSDSSPKRDPKKPFGTYNLVIKQRHLIRDQLAVSNYRIRWLIAWYL